MITTRAWLGSSVMSEASGIAGRRGESSLCNFGYLYTTDHGTSTGGAVSEQARIVVIGGGIAGCSTIYHLAQMGCTDVLLLERDELTSGSTWHAAGNVPTFSTSWSLMRVQAYSAALYRELANDADFPISYHVTGSVRLAHTPGAPRRVPPRDGDGQRPGPRLRHAQPRALVERYPLVKTHDLVGALWDPLDGDIDPSQVTQATGHARHGPQARRVRRFERVVSLEQRATTTGR